MNIDQLSPRAEYLFQRAKEENACLAFNDFELPPDCAPAATRVAFDWRDGRRLLLIDSARYPGDNPAFREFAQTGQFCADSTEAMTRFFEQIRPAFRETCVHNAPREPPAQTPAQPPASPPTVRPSRPFDPSQIQIPTPTEQANPFDRASFHADLSAEVVGQPRAVDGITGVIETHIAKRKPARPAAALFAGPSGTGKTKLACEVAIQLAKHTGQDWGFLRIDLNQLAAEHDVSRLIGSPPGYIGHEETPLFAPLLENPKQVVLFDEMEKAHPKVMQVLMNAMGSGRLEAARVARDGAHEFDFTQSILIFTSNLPFSVEHIDGLSQAEITKACRAQLSETMLPEIANRFTEILLFTELSDSAKVEIIGLSIVRLGAQYELTVCHISTELLQDTVNQILTGSGARDVEYAVEALFGAAFAAFADKNTARDVTLTGTTANIQINQFTQLSNRRSTILKEVTRRIIFSKCPQTHPRMPPKPPKTSFTAP
ncbi:MAG: AAA family ATPase, partial [Zoogloeaceae bacterium]|nr:AAA family ATPase [Zoogloeaceae bacterium]